MIEEELKRENELLKHDIAWFQEFIRVDPLRDIAFSLRTISGTLAEFYKLAFEKNEDPNPPQRDPPPVA